MNLISYLIKIKPGDFIKPKKQCDPTGMFDGIIFRVEHLTKGYLLSGRLVTQVVFSDPNGKTHCCDVSLVDKVGRSGVEKIKRSGYFLLGKLKKFHGRDNNKRQISTL